jgi:hypothetical protein
MVVSFAQLDKDKFAHVLGAAPLQSGSPRYIAWFGASVLSIALCGARWALFAKGREGRLLCRACAGIG